ncbi:hypothetical protein K438DRAFT_1188082 [Mycena galopus ATCC 62051]|nr:hypothetical protein K438DRAFT_1188082 [Mycena galopus ATCC 62051]
MRAIRCKAFLVILSNTLGHHKCFYSSKFRFWSSRITVNSVHMTPPPQELEPFRLTLTRTPTSMHYIGQLHKVEQKKKLEENASSGPAKIWPKRASTTNPPALLCKRSCGQW